MDNKHLEIEGQQAWDEYDRLAADFARTGKTWASFTDCIMMATAQLIDNDPEAFEQRVRSFQYKHAMEKHES